MRAAPPYPAPMTPHAVIVTSEGHRCPATRPAHAAYPRPMDDLSPFRVRAGAGRRRLADGVVLPHTWTAEGVVAAPAANGAQVLHLSVALCVLNDTYREAERLGIPVDGVEVSADGGFDDSWQSTGIRYSVEVDSPASADEVARLIATVDEVAEIPKVLRAGAPVDRIDAGGR